MKELEDRIRQDGIVREGNVLKVDSFLNHKCDVALYDQMGAEWARLFEGKKVDKILTIESSGIGIACVAATHFHNAPVVLAVQEPRRRAVPHPDQELHQGPHLRGHRRQAFPRAR